MIRIALIEISILCLSLLSGCAENPKLPFLGNADVHYFEKNGKVFSDTIYPKIPGFEFVNQHGKKVNNKNYKNKMWIAEFFFTSCPTICPIMNNQLKRLHKKLGREINQEIQFLSFSIDPKNDTPAALLSYQKSHRLNYTNWDFLCGNEEETHQLGIQNFLTFAGKDDESAGGYAHSGSFTLVDKDGYVRGVYSVTNFDLSVNEQEFDRMVKEIKILYDEHINTK